MPGKTTRPKGKTGKLFFFNAINYWIYKLSTIFVSHNQNNIIVKIFSSNFLKVHFQNQTHY